MNAAVCVLRTTVFVLNCLLQCVETSSDLLLILPSDSASRLQQVLKLKT